MLKTERQKKTQIKMAVGCNNKSIIAFLNFSHI